MAARQTVKDQDVPEPDRLGAYPHPRDTQALFGQEAAERALLDAYRSGRMHHAWLLQGEEGIGKATLAYRLARFVLTHPDPAAPAAMAAQTLDVPPDTPAARRIAAQAHPDLHVLRRAYDPARKAVAGVITVDAVRKGLHLLAMTAGEGGWRVLIVDAADDLNVNAANALLKTLEEPPPNALLLLVSHAPGRLLATIRSRCRRLALARLDDDALIAALRLAGAGAALDRLSEQDRAALMQLARGSARRALTFLGGDGLALWRQIDALLNAAPRIDALKAHALAGKLGRAGGQDDFSLAMTMIGDGIAAKVEQGARSGQNPADLARLAGVWEKTGRLAAQTEIYHFDRKQMILSLFRSISEAMR